ncbi:hypothetical protein V9T40_010645 [Parthenolecanium corni]|uniref:Peroxidasin n=1 Tax=Parthenolecanium corni TaxID=536013 RepID=A0AAN9T5B5_9HEMI
MRHIIDEISRGLLSTPVETLDQFITKEITNHLFEDKKIPFSGMDLPALNIQRARDHGIPSYNEFRAMCNLKRATTWEDFAKELPADVITRLKRLYPTVDDVDLFPAGISENPIPGGLVGPTFACIISIQYRQLRKCDRFWYETSDPLLKFSPEQLIEIRKATLSRIICDNLDVPSPVQRWAFDLPSEENPRVPCQSLPRTNLKAWQENQNGCHFRGRFFSVGESYLPTPCTSCICTIQGVRCATIRVTNCLKLIQEVGQAAVLRDEVCSVQCSSYITLKEDGTLSERLPEGRAVNLFNADGLRPPPLNQRRKVPTTRSFKLRDFAIVVG